MYRFELITVFIFLLVFSSCSSLQSRGEREKSTSKISSAQDFAAQKNERILLEKNLEQLVKDAELKGEMAKQFLSGDFYFKASDASVHGYHELAAQLYKMILKMYPSDSFVEKRYVVELIRVNELSEAKQRLSKIVKDENYSDESMGLLLGGLQAALNESGKAKKTYSILLEKHPKSEEACIFLAKSYSLESQLKKARALLRKCEKKIPERGIFSYYLGKIEANQGRFKQAKKAFKNSLKINPEYVQSVIALGAILEREEKTKKALYYYKDFLKLVPENYQVLSRIVQLLFSQEKYEEVLPFAKKLSQIDPNDLNLKVRLGILYTDTENFDAAKTVFEDVLKEVPSSDKVIYYLGSLYQQTGEMMKAVETFSKLTEESSLFHDGHVQIAKILEFLAQEEFENNDKKYGENFERFKTFVEENSKKYSSLKMDLGLILASFHEGNRNYLEAISKVEEISTHEKFNNQHRFYLASLYEKQNQFPEAQKLVEEILKNEPNNANALNFLGYSFVERGINMDQAYLYIQKAVQLRPEDGYIRDSLGWYYYKVGKFDDALREITLAWELTKSDPVIIRHLAMVYQEKKSYTKAHNFYMEALKHCTLESEKIVVEKAIQQLNQLRLPASK